VKISAMLLQSRVAKKMILNVNASINKACGLALEEDNTDASIYCADAETTWCGDDATFFLLFSDCFTIQFQHL
jgi:hypothetical protein